MIKLSQKNINNIIRRYKRGEKVLKLSESYGVARNRIYELVSEYKETGCVPIQKIPGRKKNSIRSDELSIILKCYSECKLGANGLEEYIFRTRRVHISHNKIHRVLLENNLAIENLKKKKQRKYCRYERNHSMTLWHTDWKEILIDGNIKYITAFIDDRSRFVVSSGIFDNQTVENTITVLKNGINTYGCPEQIVTDNGSQYVTIRCEDQSGHIFGQFLREHNIKHIRSRVRHPQTNGKIERFFGEIDKRIHQFESLDEIVYWQNYIKPHRSIGYNVPADIFWHALKPERIFEYVNGWFWDILLVEEEHD